MKKPANTNVTANKDTLKLESFKVTRVKQWDDGNVSFDMVMNGISIYGCRVQESEEGDFVRFPSRKGGDGKYYSIVWARLSKDDNDAIIEEVENQLNA